MKPPTTELDKNGNLIVHPAEARPHGHPTNLYDPDAHDDQIVVMFNTRDDAQSAISMLQAEGVAADATITDRTADGANAGVNAEGGNTGLWGSLKGLFAQDDEVHGLAEGVRRGHALLVIHPKLETRKRVVQILEASGPVEFDARLEEWRTQGWINLQVEKDAAKGEQEVQRRSGTRDLDRGSPTVRSYYAPRT